MKVLLFLSCIFSVVTPISISPRAGSKCAYSSNKIFCYGGKPDNANYDNNIYSLDFNKINGGLVSDLIRQWTLVTVNKNPDVPINEYRYASQFIALPDGSMYFDGGYNEDHPLKAKTIAYNIENNTWSVLPSFNDVKNGGYRQTFSGTAVYLPHTNTIAFYGGKRSGAVLNATYTTNNELLHVTYETISEQYPTKKLIESAVGYYYLTLLHLNSNVWAVPKVEPLRLHGFPILASYQTATFHPRTKQILYIGGYLRDGALKGSTVPLDHYIAFDTMATTWLLQNLTGINVPGPRYLHTATLLNTEDDILVYGGVFQPDNETLNPTLVSDYIYTLDLTTFVWTPHNKIPEPTGPRANHTAVLVNDTSLFIMFGKRKSSTNASFVAVNSILVLDVKDRTSLSFLDSYPLTKDADPVMTATSNASGLSGGAIAGIVVGIVAALVIVVAVVLYCVKRKSKEEKIKEIHVDWDGIDGGYREDPPVAAGFSVGSTSPITTVVPPVYVPSDTIEKPNSASLSYSLALENTNLVKPDVYEGSKNKTKPDSDANSRSMDGLL